jgi:uncharacterized protein YjbI with pentapeptide repeats
MKVPSALFSFFIGLTLNQLALAYDIVDLNKLLDTNLCRRCDLSGANLSGAKLNGVEMHKANLKSVNLNRAELRGAILRRANLIDANLIEADLREAKLSGAFLTGATLKGATLNQANLTHTDLVDTNLIEADVSEAILLGADLSGANLSHANMRGVNLSGANFTGSNLSGVDLTGAYLYGSTMIKANLRGANFENAKLSGINFTDSNLKGANLGIGKVEEAGWSPEINQISIKEIGVYGEVTDFDLNGDTHYLTSRSGKLYELKQGLSKVLLDLSKDQQFLNKDEVGLLSVVSNNQLIYISYAIQEDDDDESMFLVVDEYTNKMRKIRRVAKINTASSSHVAGTLAFDSFGKLYLSVGDGSDPEHQPQNLQSLLGKILRFDVSKARPEPEIVAYGLRNPWKFSIDGRNRMFIGDVGSQIKESVYLLEDLYPAAPHNLGWPVFEGTTRIGNSPFKLDDTLLPIFEYRNESPLGIAVIGGFYLDDNDVYLFGDLLGNLRLLKKQMDDKWYEIHFQKTSNMIWSFGYDSRTKKSYMSGAEKIFELEILNKRINRFSSVIFCRTTMPDGVVNNSGC